MTWLLLAAGFMLGGLSVIALEVLYIVQMIAAAEDFLDQLAMSVLP